MKIQKRRKGSFNKKIISTLLICFGIIAIAYPFIQDYMVSHLSGQLADMEFSENIEEATYDFSEIAMIGTDDIIAVAKDIKKLRTIGRIEIPRVKLKLAIFEGVSKANMSAGAATLKPNQTMGYGNYALASHHMKNPRLLFSPLDRVKLGDTIYLTDNITTYEYTVIEKRVIEPTNTEVIDDKEDQAIVSLITCNSNGKKRLLVVGELVSDDSGKEEDEYL